MSTSSHSDMTSTRLPQAPHPTDNEKDDSTFTFIIIGVFFAILAVVVVAGIVTLVFYRKRQKRQSRRLLESVSPDDLTIRTMPSRVVSYDRAFSESRRPFESNEQCAGRGGVDGSESIRFMSTSAKNISVVYKSSKEKSRENTVNKVDCILEEVPSNHTSDDITVQNIVKRNNGIDNSAYDKNIPNEEVPPNRHENGDKQEYAYDSDVIERQTYDSRDTKIESNSYFNPNKSPNASPKTRTLPPLKNTKNQVLSEQTDGIREGDSEPECKTQGVSNHNSENSMDSKDCLKKSTLKPKYKTINNISRIKNKSNINQMSEAGRKLNDSVSEYAVPFSMPKVGNNSEDIDKTESEIETQVQETSTTESYLQAQDTENNFTKNSVNVPQCVQPLNTIKGKSPLFPPKSKKTSSSPDHMRVKKPIFPELTLKRTDSELKTNLREDEEIPYENASVFTVNKRNDETRSYNSLTEPTQKIKPTIPKLNVNRSKSEMKHKLITDDNEFPKYENISVSAVDGMNDENLHHSSPESAGISSPDYVDPDAPDVLVERGEYTLVKNSRMNSPIADFVAADNDFPDYENTNNLQTLRTGKHDFVKSGPGTLSPTSPAHKYIDVLGDPAFWQATNEQESPVDSMPGYVDMEKGIACTDKRSKTFSESEDMDYSYAFPTVPNAGATGHSQAVSFVDQADYYNIDFNTAVDILKTST